MFKLKSTRGHSIPYYYTKYLTVLKKNLITPAFHRDRHEVFPSVHTFMILLRELKINPRAPLWHGPKSFQSHLTRGNQNTEEKERGESRYADKVTHPSAKHDTLYSCSRVSVSQ